jgi:hypothetical protein
MRFSKKLQLRIETTIFYLGSHTEYWFRVSGVGKFLPKPACQAIALQSEGWTPDTRNPKEMKNIGNQVSSFEFQVSGNKIDTVDIPQIITRRMLYETAKRR